VQHTDALQPLAAERDQLMQMRPRGMQAGGSPSLISASTSPSYTAVEPYRMSAFHLIDANRPPSWKFTPSCAPALLG
jgi:hypothetical protein